MHCIPRRLNLVASVFLLCSLGMAQRVTVVNMVSTVNSGETNDDSEPHLSVDPASPLHIVATAFTPADPGAPANTAPLYLSSDGGATWVHSNIIPLINAAACGGTCDITTAFSPNAASVNTGSGTLFLSWVDSDNATPPNHPMRVLRVQPFPTPPTRLILLENIPGTDKLIFDQPFTQAGNNAGNDAIYVGGANRGVATINQDLLSGFDLLPLEARSNCGQDGPSVRPAVHPTGIAYVAFFRWTNCSNPRMADLVLVRDDNWGAGFAGAGGYKALVDDGDGKLGKRVATGLTIPFGMLGIERVIGSLSIAVDPNDNHRVWIVWAAGNPYTLHVRLSTDGGSTWSSQDLKTIPSATNPALAVNQAGRLGFLYQKFVKPGTCSNAGNDTGGGCWQSQVETTMDGVTWADPIVLGNTPNLRANTRGPAYGDYDHMVAVGGDFYGVFSAFNTPVRDNFPNGVTYQRFASFGGQQLFADADQTVPVRPSVDPYFFAIKFSPTVTWVNPYSTPCGVPTRLTIEGTNLFNIKQVSCGGQPLANVNVINTSSRIAADIPQALTLSAGQCEVVVDTAEGSSAQPRTGSGTDLFAVAPTVTGVSPAIGPIVGGYEVTLRGGCFRDDMEVFFGDAKAARTFDSCSAGSTQCAVLAPTGSMAGPVPVRASVAGVRSAIDSREFSYIGPTITGISPNKGPVTGGTKIVISGTGVGPEDLGVFTASFDDVVVHGLQCLDAPPGSCGILTPPASGPRQVHVSVTAFGATSPPSPRGDDIFTYDNNLVLTAFFWNSFTGKYVVQLSGNAPSPNGAPIQLTIRDSNRVVPMPNPVVVPGGASSVEITLTALPGPQAETVTVTASYGGNSASVMLNLAAWPAVSISTDSDVLNSGESTTATVTINTPAPPNAVVSISSSDSAAAPVPQQPLSFNVGEFEVNFPITVQSSVRKDVTIRATYNGTSASTSLRVNPCIQRQCPRGRYWDPDLCRCVPGPPR